MSSQTLLLSLIVGLPLLGFLFNGIIGLSFPSYRRKKGLIGGIANMVVFAPFFIALYLLFQVTGGAEPITVNLYTWMQAGSFEVDIAYRLDQLSLMMTLVVTGVGALIHLYSIGYMHEDDGYWKFFPYFNLFIFAMLNLVLADNLLLLFLGWEGVGLCSYLLIGFWYKDMNNSAAGTKAFLYNRIGDFAFLIGLFLLFQGLGTLNITEILNNLHNLPSHYVFWICLMFLIGATGKSAQLPLFVWLPDAMAGPTSVSALIHAATMVTSGVYLISRMSPLYAIAPTAMMVVAVVGAVTALVAATIAMTQHDIKRVLAYSTVSQLGYMFLALGAGGYTAAMFHVMTHAFFKACLFLGSGSVIHAMEHVEHKLHDDGKEVDFDPQDMRNMGGLKKYLPSTYKTFFISTLAIAGIPPLAGFFSKDEILAFAFNAGLGEHAGALYIGLWGIGIITAFLTAFYMFRLTLNTFNGPFKLPEKYSEAKGAEGYLHESPATMTLPLWILAGLAIVGGFIGVPNFIASTFTGGEAHINLLHNFLYGTTATVDLHMAPIIEWTLLLVSVAVAILGMAVAYRFYSKGQVEASDAAVAGRFGGLYRIWANKYRFDEIYEGYVANPIVKFSDKVLAVFDMKIVDGIVNAVGGIVRLFGSLFRYIQTGVVSSYALMMVLGVIIILSILIM